MRLSQEERQRVRALRRRIREAYVTQLRRRVETVVEPCRAWKVELVLLPEYSVPWEAVPSLARAAADLVVVAGTHAVDRAALQSRFYGELGFSPEPKIGEAACPVDVAPLLGGENVGSVQDALDAGQGVLEAAADAGMRGRRLHRLLGMVDGLTQVEQARRCLREVVLPADVVPMPLLRQALALGGDEGPSAPRVGRSRRRGDGSRSVGSPGTELEFAL